MARPTPPYLGSAYYPEAWPLEQIDEDVALMLQAGMNVARMGEFAWSRMEPSEAQFDFTWLHLAVDKLGAAGIGIIMCTPTCTPPAWLVERYPEVLIMDDNGVRTEHGARRHACPTSPSYRDLCARIVARLADEFAADRNVVGWQIDNELYPSGGRGCCCPVCISGFRDALRKRFGTVQALNEAWGTDLWSQTHQDFERIPVPRRGTWHHPSLQTAWMEYQSDSYVAFSDAQADLLHAKGCKMVGTDMMPFGGLNYHKIHRKLDLVQFNHYNNMDTLWHAAFWMDYCRPIKPVPFWNTETATCWNGATTANGYKEPGFCRVNSWLPVALGGEANCYWLWRAHWSGQELMHGSVVDSWGRPLHIIGEVQEISTGFRTAGTFLSHTRPDVSGLALHFSCWAWLLYEFQSQVNGFQYGGKLTNAVYQPLLAGGWRPDIIDPAASLDPYRVVLSPFLPSLEESGLRDRLLDWIRAGGTWVAGPMTDNRTLHATKYRIAPFSVLEDWASVRVKHQIPGDPRDFGVRWTDGRDSKGSIWYDGLEPSEAETLATYTEGPVAGLSAVVRRAMGKGQIVLLGTMPQPDDFRAYLAELIPPAIRATDNVLAVPRSGPGGKGMVIVELHNRPGSVDLPSPGTDLLTRKTVSGKLEIAPCGVYVIQY